jgi:predicted Zn-dependent protease
MLRARIVVKRLDLALGPELRATPTQFDVRKIAGLFFQATSSDGGSRTFRYFLMSEDLKDPDLRYVFAESFGAPWHVGIVSTARLVGNDGRPGETRADVTALRVYKLVLKSVARLAGYTESQGCILSFPRSLLELDRKSSEFCDHDHLALVDAGILKPTPSAGCAQIATILP